MEAYMAELTSPASVLENYKLSAQTQNAVNRKPGNVIDQEAFLKILVAQLQNQDPTAPQDDQQFVQQMATLSMVEQMTTMNASSAQSQAFGLIGKGIIGLSGNEGELFPMEVTGIVESAGFMNGKAYVMVGDRQIYLNKISQVFDSSAISGSNVLEGASIVDKYVRYQTGVDADGNVLSDVGQVSKAVFKNGLIFLSIGDREVPLGSVLEVAGAPIE